jgi:hypothetical protein
MLKGITKKISFQEKQPQLAEITGIIRASSAAFEDPLLSSSDEDLPKKQYDQRATVTLIYWLWKMKL